MVQNLIREGLITGIGILDSQHSELAESISGVIDMLAKSADKNAVREILSEIKSAADRHFFTEEKFMDDSLYPDTAGHKKLHREFLQEFMKYALRAQNGHTGPAFAREFRENVADWFVLHIKMNDLKLAACINAGRGQSTRAAF